MRRAPLRRFPYGVFYVVRDNRVDVLAVYHARRRPRVFEGYRRLLGASGNE